MKESGGGLGTHTMLRGELEMQPNDLCSYCLFRDTSNAPKQVTNPTGMVVLAQSDLLVGLGE